jgi:hypothetical protein
MKAIETGVTLKKMVIIIIVGAASSFGTPFGYVRLPGKGNSDSHGARPVH